MKNIKLFLVLTLLTGLVYPCLMTLIGQVLFHAQSNGSLFVAREKIIGSYLIGQNFDQDKYFWSRPSAVNYNPLPSGGSNYSATSKVLHDQIAARMKTAQIPADLIYASASGLDPHLSPAAAKFQVERVAKARHLSSSKLLELIDKITEKRDFGLLGEPRVNVLRLNKMVDDFSERQE